MTGLFVRAASQAEDVQARLRAALESSGQATKANVTALLAQASALERVSRFNDEAIASAQGYLVATGRTVQEVERLTPKLVDIAALFKLDLSEAAVAFNLAMQGNTRVLKRLGINVKDLGVEIKTVDDLLRVLGDKGLGAAARDANTFSGALARLKNQVNNIQEALGSPLLAPFTKMLNVLTNAAIAVQDFGKKFPLVAVGVSTFLVLMGTTLVAFAAYSLVLAKIIPQMFVFGAAQVQAAQFGLRLAASVGLTTKAVALLSAVLRANLIGLLITGVLVLITNFNNLGDTFHRVFSFMIALVREFGQALIDINVGMLTGSIARVNKGLDRLRNAFATANQESKEVVNAMRQVRAAADDAAGGIDEAAKTAEELTDAFAKASSEATLLSSKMQVLANESARLALSQQGLSAADIVAIEAKRLEAVREATEDQIRFTIAAKREEIAGLARIEGDQTKQLLKAKGELSALEVQLSQSRVESAKKTAERVVELETKLAADRLQIEQDLVASRADLARKQIEADREVGDARARLEQELSRQRLDLFKVEEETRLAMIRRVVAAEISLGATILQARRDILDIQFRREDALLRVRARERAQLVKEGALLEIDAERANAEERSRLVRDNIKRQFEIEEERVALLKQQRVIELALAQATFTSKVAIIRAEIEAKKAAITADEALQIEAIRSRLELLRLETQEKIDQLQLQLQAKREELKAELDAEVAFGSRSAAEAARIKQRIDAIDATFANKAKALVQSVVVANRSAAEQILIIQRSAVAQREALGKQEAAQQAQAQIEFQTRFNEVQQAGVKDRIDSQRKLADLEIDLLNSIQDERERLRGAGESEGEIARLLAPSTNLLATVQRVQKGIAAGTEKDLGVLSNVYKKFADDVKGFLQPVMDLIEKIANPDALLQALNTMRPALAVAGAPAAAATGGVVNNFNFSGVTVTLTADEAALLQRVLGRLLGPDGRRVLDTILRSQPGPRT